jgi:mannose-6-phosphate isomerase-like protein (cupin superfamily)
MEPRLAQLAVPPCTGLLHDFSQGDLPTLVSGWSRETLPLSNSGTHFGFVGSGSARLSFENRSYQLDEGMYFAVPRTAEVAGDGFGFVATRLDYRGFFHLGGPIEEQGRLRYIDGCTDSLLIPPVMKGDPCLNLLSVPKHTDQTSHTHPSLRVGMIVRGRGLCRTELGPVELSPGLIFHLPADFVHSFHTREESLLIVAWHPDSEFGPTHEEHPMLNRTLIDGQTASRRLFPRKGRHEMS